MGNHQVRFLGEGAAEMPLPYPTPATVESDLPLDLPVQLFHKAVVGKIMEAPLRSPHRRFMTA
jgi:hypothetical protein